MQNQEHQSRKSLNEEKVLKRHLVLKFHNPTSIKRENNENLYTRTN